MKTKKQLIDFEHKGNEKHSFKLRPALMSLCMLTFIGGYSQTGQVNLNLKNASVKELFREIEKQTSYRFSYRDAEINNKGGITISGQGRELKEVLTNELAKQQLSYTVSGNKIIISPVKNAVSTKEKKVTGKVVDAKGEPVIGATIMEKGTNNGTITDFDGNFMLDVSAGAVLQISYIGYANQDVKVGNSSNLAITMKEDTELLDEVVVVGYGTQKKVNLTGSVTSVNKEVLADRPVSNVMQSLQGEVPGLTISTGGAPGSTSSIRLRGQGSLSNKGNTPPYILIDGVPSDESTMLGLNPDDVENISVLKDAAASAIYGARAAYGVILITTKSSSGKKDKLTVNYSNNLDFAAFTVIPDMVNSIQFAEAYNEAYANAGLAPMFTEEWFEKARRRMNDPNAPATEPVEGQPNMWKNTFDSFDNVDWYEVYYKPGFSSFQQKHTLSLSGTTEKINYYISAGLRDNGSNMRYGDWKNTQYSGLARLNAKVTNWLDVGLNIRYANGITMEPTGNFNGTGTSIIYHNMWRGWPMTYLKDPNGNYNANISNVPYLIDGGTTEKTKEQIVITPSFVVKPIDGLTINFDFTTDMLFNTTKAERQNVPTYLVDGSIDQATWNTHQAQTFAYKDFNRRHYMTYNLFATYSKQLSDHYISAMIGMQQENSKTMGASAKRFNLLFPSLPTLGLSDGDRVVGDNESEWSTFGSFVRLNYNYKEKYLVELNGRYDGSAKFRSGKRWGFFPSFSFAYNIAREEYWEKLLDYINSMKVRFSFGRLGNQNVSSFTFLPQMSHGLADFIMGTNRPLYVSSPGLINSDLTWEKSQTVNFGLDLGLFSNRLTASLDVYKRKTYDMFGPAEKLPAVIGATIPQSNNAALSTTGFDLVMGWRDNIQDFCYGLGFTLSDYRTKIDKYYNPTGTFANENWSEGRYLGEIWGYETDRFFREDDFTKDANGNYHLKDGIANQDFIYTKWSPGDIKYVDQNNDGKIDQGQNTIYDHGDKILLGNSTPRFQYGINIDLGYKGFDFRMFLQGIGKRDVWYNDVTFWGFQDRAQSNFTLSHLDYWSEDNQDAYYPKPYLQGDKIAKNQQAQSKYILDGSYMRVKNIQFGYTFPKKILSKISLDNLRLYVSGENLFTFTKFPEFYDPEAYGKTHPLQKHISFGVNVSF